MNINQLLILTFIIFFYTINHNKKNSIYEKFLMEKYQKKHVLKEY